VSQAGSCDSNVNHRLTLAQATVVTTKQEVRLINDPGQVQLGLEGLLELDGKKILVCRGGDVNKIVRQVYTKFLNSRDATGESFRFSKKARG
jgi:hypothetical protein